MENNNFNDILYAALRKAAQENPEAFKETSSNELEEENRKLKEDIRRKNMLILSLINQSEKLLEMSNDLINAAFSDEEPSDEIKEGLESINTIRSVNKLIKMIVEFEEKGGI
jgi:hypothetical protein